MKKCKRRHSDCGEFTISNIIIFIVSAIAIFSITVISVNAQKTPIFNDNMEKYVARNSKEKQIINIINNDLKRGYSERRLELISKHLSESFIHHLMIDSQSELVEDKSEFLDNRSTWAATQVDLEAQYQLRSIEFDKADNTYTAILISSYIGKYFTDRFLEIIKFERINENFLVQDHIKIPVLPKNPNRLKVEIIVTEKLDSFSENFPSESEFYGGDAIISDIESSRGLDEIPTDNERVTVLFVFRESPPIGSKITIQHSWLGDGHPSPARFDYDVVEYKPTFVIENTSWIGCCTGDIITFEVFLNGELVTKRDVNAR